MKYAVTILILLAGLAGPTARAEGYGPTAKMHSAAAADALRFAASRDSASPASFRECVVAVPRTRFEEAARASLLMRFTEAELAIIDEFNRSPTAARYTRYNWDVFLASHGAGPANPAQLSAEDVATLEQFESTPVGAKYMVELDRGPQAQDDPLVVALRAYVTTCRQGS